MYSDYDMQSTFSAMTSDFGSQMLLHGNDSDMDEEEEEEERGGEEGRVGYHGVCEMGMDQRELDGAPRLKLGLNDVSTLDRGTRNGLCFCLFVNIVPRKHVLSGITTSFSFLNDLFAKQCK